MKTSRWVVLLALLLLIGGVGAWWLASGNQPESATPARRAIASGADDDEARLPAPASDARQVAPLVADAHGPTGAALDAPAPVPAPRQAPGVPVAFRGRVLRGGVPLSGASVLYRGSTPLREALRRTADPAVPELELLPRTSTGPDGRFSLTSRFLPGEAWDWEDGYPYLIVLAEGCAPRSVRCVGCTGGGFDAGDICIETGGWLTGRVLDEAGAPLAGADISLQSAKAASPDCGLERPYFDQHVKDCTRTTSYADGRFRAGPFWPGTATLVVSAPDRLAATLEPQEIKVGTDEHVGDVVLRSGLSLAGIVVGPDGVPVPGARLRLWKPRGTDGLRETQGLPDSLVVRLATLFRATEGRSDAAGRFAMGGLVASNYSLAVQAEGWEWRIVDDLLPGPQSVRVDLAPAARLELTLLEDPGGSPCATATVTASRLCGNGQQPLTPRATGAPGAWVVEPLGPGGTDIFVAAEGRGGVALHLDGVKAGEVASRTLRLPAQAILGGRVTDVSGAPLPGLEVVASFHADPAEEHAARVPGTKAVTAADGGFELRGLQAGEWSIAADDASHLPAERTVTVTSGVRVADIDLVLGPSGAIFGTSMDEAGQPLVGSRVYGQLHAAEGVQPRQIEAYTDTTGRYELSDLEAGTWSVGVEDNIDVPLAAGERRQLDLQEGAQTVLVVRVLDAEGRPAPNAVVCFGQVSEGADYVQLTPMPTGADGTCRNEHARAGPCSVLAVLEGGAGQTPVTRLDVPERRTTTLDLRVGGARALVRVTDASSGKPVPGVVAALVALREDGEPAGYASMRLNGQRRTFGATSDEAGIVHLAGLAPGRFRLAVTGEAFKLVTLPAPIVEVRGTETAELDIVVTATARISGKAHDAAGVPVRDGVYVSAFGPMEEDRSLAIARSGAFSLDGLRPGAWHLIVAELPTERSGESGGKVFTERTVTLQPGQALEVDLVADG
ncbi:MAG TPA: carboxypeptidase-like regulatory domain-containing protein [Planctomycetota bacterium]|nr:carboxypeptidase-like regulatory domain-containing protein [Planctomycetota bacterium]